MRVAAVLVLALLGCSEPLPVEAAPVEAPPVAPAGMIHVPSGGLPMVDAASVAVAGFFLDRAPVSVGAFRTYVSSTEPTFATREGGAVFSSARGGFEIRAHADYEHPTGSESLAPDDHPATQITASEAEAFCAARGARLPTEHEWEHAARNGRGDTSLYPWGDSLEDTEGRPRANVWQGAFPTANTLADGYLYASPIGAFPPTPLGFVDLVGNVWQWTSSVFDAEHASAAAPARVIRGGSFLCDARVCHGYRIAARQSADPQSPSMHVGFRCARDR